MFRGLERAQENFSNPHKSEGYSLLPLRGVGECLILERVNRFTVKVEIEGREGLAFLQNTGRLLGYIVRGRTGFCVPVASPKKLGRRLFAIHDNGLAAVVDTLLHSKVFEEAVSHGLICWLEGYRILRRDVPLANSRIDYLMTGGGGDALVELKSAVLRLGYYASYPDCPSSRAVRQVTDLLKLVEHGARAILVFIAAIPYIRGFKLNYEADPVLCDLIVRAHGAGLEVKGVQIAYEPVSSSIILLNPDLPIEI